MQSSRFHSITARLSGMNLRTSFSRRSASSSTTSSAVQSPSSSRAPSTSRGGAAAAPGGARRSYASSNGMSFSSTDSAALSPVSVSINSIVFRRPSVLDLEEERRSYGPELVGLLEPRPVVMCAASLDEKMGSLY